MATEAPIQDLPPDNERSSGTMTLLEHLLELRVRVTWMAAAVMAGMIVFFIPPVGFGAIEILKEPAFKQNAEFQTQAITPMENIVTYFRVALLGGVAIGMPVLVYQTIRFIAPALTPSEKRWVYPIALGTSISFVLGMLFAYYIVLPPAFTFLFNFGKEQIADPNPTISSYMDLTTRLILVLGLVFEVPILVMGLAKLGIVSARRLFGWWRWAIVGAFAISAVATPTPDPVVQTLVAGPMLILYFLGIGLAWLVRRD